MNKLAQRKKAGAIPCPTPKHQRNAEPAVVCNDACMKLVVFALRSLSTLSGCAACFAANMDLLLTYIEGDKYHPITCSATASTRKASKKTGRKKKSYVSSSAVIDPASVAAEVYTAAKPSKAACVHTVALEAVFDESQFEDFPELVRSSARAAVRFDCFVLIARCVCYRRTLRSRRSVKSCPSKRSDDRVAVLP